MTPHQASLTTGKIGSAGKLEVTVDQQPQHEPAQPRGRRPAGALEHAVLAVLWAAEQPLSAAAVYDGLGDTELAYKTVLTVLNRLCDKGTVIRAKAGRAYLFTPRVDAAEAVAQQMSAALATRRDRTTVLQRFLAQLSDDDSAALRALLHGE